MKSREHIALEVALDSLQVHLVSIREAHASTLNNTQTDESLENLSEILESILRQLEVELR